MGPGLLAPGSRLVSVLTGHVGDYKTMAVRGVCLPTLQSQGPDVCCFESLTCGSNMAGDTVGGRGLSCHACVCT